MLHGLKDALNKASAQAQSSFQAQLERHKKLEDFGKEGEQTPSTFDQIQAGLRSGRTKLDWRQDASTLKLQLCQRALKGAASDASSLGQSEKILARSVSDWTAPSKGATADLGDKLAALHFLAGRAHIEYGKEVDQSRSGLKELRDAEQKLGPKRDKRAVFEKQIYEALKLPSTAETSQRIGTLQAQLNKLTEEDAAEEAAVAKLAERNTGAVFDREFGAMIKLGEQLALIGIHGRAMIEARYDPARLAGLHQAAQTAFEGWKPSNSFTPRPNISSSIATPVHSQSFRESHASELQALSLAQHQSAAPENDETGSQNARHHRVPPPMLPPRGQDPSTTSVSQSLPDGSAMPPINLEPAPLQHPSSPPQGESRGQKLPGAFDESPRSPEPPADTLPGLNAPTVAETGQPIIGTGGPSSGQLGTPLSSSGNTTMQSEASRRKDAEGTA